MNIKNLFLAFSCFISSTLFCKQKRNLQPGDTAPAFALADESGKIRTLQEFKGHKVVLFFYPKDASPGCTKEACSLRDAFDIYQKNNIILLGVSYDSVASHARFQSKHHLPFSLLADTKGNIAAAYGANHFCLFNIVPQRKTFLIDEQGNIVAVMHKVNVNSHAQDILKAFGIKISNHDR